MTSALRSHPVEGPGCHSDLFHFLVGGRQQHQVDLKDCTGTPVVIPHTVVFEHQYPRWWYWHDEANGGELRLRTGGDELQAASVLDFFRRNEPHVHGRRLGCIACYTYEVPPPNGEGSPSVAVDYHTAESLETFLFEPRDVKKTRGFLQLPVVTKEDHYTVVMATWSPKICIVRRRQSKVMLSEVRAPSLHRFATFDDPEQFSIESRCAPTTNARVASACAAIAKVLLKAHHCRVSSANFYFATDQRNRLVLLWCGALTVASTDSQADSPSGGASAGVLEETIPPSLLNGPDVRSGGGNSAASTGAPGAAKSVPQQLALVELREDALLLEDGRASPHRKRIVQRQKLAQRRAEAAAQVAASLPASSVAAPSSSLRNPAAVLQPRRRSSVGGLSSASFTPAQLAVASEANKLWSAAWFEATPEIQRQYEALRKRRDGALLSVSDVIYRALDEFRSERNATAAAAASSKGGPSLSLDASSSQRGASSMDAKAFDVPEDLAPHLGGDDVLSQLTAEIGISVDSTGRWLIHPPCDPHDAVSHPPCVHIEAACKAWINSYFDRRNAELQCESLKYLSQRALQMAFQVPC